MILICLWSRFTFWSAKTRGFLWNIRVPAVNTWLSSLKDERRNEIPFPLSSIIRGKIARTKCRFPYVATELSTYLWDLLVLFCLQPLLIKLKPWKTPRGIVFSWYFSVISLLKSNYSFFFSQILSIYTWIEENHDESFKASDRIKSYDLFKIHLV